MARVLLLASDLLASAALRAELEGSGHRVDGLGDAPARPDVVVISVPGTVAERTRLVGTLEAHLGAKDVPSILFGDNVPAELVDRLRRKLDIRAIVPTETRAEVMHELEAIVRASRMPPPPPARSSGRYDDRIFIDATGVVRPIGPTAARRLRRRRGEFRILPSPDDIAIMERTSADARLRLAGEITAAGVMCDVMSMIAGMQLGGELVIDDGNATRSLLLEPGHVVSAQSSAHSERLGEVLYRRGVLSREQLAKASARAHEGSLRFGEAVVEMGFLAREKLFLLMAQQVEEIFYAAVTQDHGMFYFLDAYDASRLWFRQRQPILGMLLLSVKRMDEMRYFREKVPSDAHVPERVQGRTGPSTDGSAAVVYAAIDGTRSVADICRHLREPELDVTRALFELAQLGLAVIGPPRQPSIRAIVDVFNSAMVLLMRELDAMDQGDAVRVELARFVRHHGLYAALLRDARPAEDGTLDAARISANVARLSSPEEADNVLAAALREYAAYAMFLARPHLRRAEVGLRPSEQPRPKRRPVSGTFREVLAPLSSEDESTPPSAREPE